MKFGAEIMSSLTELAQTAFAIAFLTAWLFCCISVAFLLRIVSVFDLSSKELPGGNNARNDGGFVIPYLREQLLKSKTFLTEVPKGLGI
jgi:hypothetical protein